jgi:hypothetical protein
MAETPIYGMKRIAQEIEVSESRLYRWRRTPEGAFIAVGSMGNAGGGLGLAAWTFPSSAQHFKQIMTARVRAERRRAANIRWGYTDVSSRQAL